MAASSVSYKLRCSLIGHSMDIRAVAVSPEGEIVTASRDKTAKLWVESINNSNVYEVKVTYGGHSAYVTSVCLVPSSDNNPDTALALTGSQDKSILVFPRYSPTPIRTLEGHTDTVSCLCWSNGLLVSGSWDHTLRVWHNWEFVSELKGHTGPIWSAEILKKEGAKMPVVLSASADRSIILWKDYKVSHTYTGHTDCVRSLCTIPGDLFISTSNDATVKVWHLSGDCLATHYGHTNFIYCISLIDSSGDFVTGGEDRTVRVWDNSGNNLQTINMPAQSIWCVAVLPNADLVVGTSDGACRIFSRVAERQADEQTLEEFAASVSQSKIAIEDLGGVKKSEFPDKSILFSPGKSNGQTVIVRDGDKLQCHKWSARQQLWENIGEVVGGSGGSASSSGKVLHNGREYDFVFSVDIDDGKVLKLPYNKTDDPWMVAQNFIHMHELPQDYLDKVANFICLNAGVSSNSALPAYVDPFTGGSRYVPRAASTSSTGYNDPFTGTGGYVPHSSASSSSQHFPQSTPSLFTNINKEGLLRKFTESNSFVDEKLPDGAIQKLIDSVTSDNMSADILTSLEPALGWPTEKVWPALDVLRLALRFSNVHNALFSSDKGDTVVNLLFTCLESSVPNAQLLSLRCLSNMAAHSLGQTCLKKLSQTVATKISQAELPNKNIEIGAATALLNCAIILVKLNASYQLEDVCQILSAATKLLLTSANEDAAYRSLQCVGTLLAAGDDIRALAASLDIKTTIEDQASRTSVPNVSECANEVMKHLS